MSNPTLVTTGTPYTGFTLATIVERLLATFGLTEDSTTGRTPASTEESAQARIFVRRAVSLLNGKFPSIWSLREVAGTWVAGDHSVLLPAGCRSVLYVIYDGLPLEGNNYDDYLRTLVPDSATGATQAPKTGSGRVIGYRVTGYSNQSTSDNRPVLRLFDTPQEAKAYTVCYNTLAPALTSETDTLPIMQTFQEWVLAKSRELWATELNDLAQKSAAAVDLKRMEDDLIPDTDAMLELPHRVKWRFPTEAGRFHRRVGW